MLRLGDGTEVSHERMQAGLERVWPYVEELFDASWIAPAAARATASPSTSGPCGPAWEAYLRAVLAEATLELARTVRSGPGGGRRGIHTEAMGYLLAEMQYLHRSHPAPAGSSCSPPPDDGQGGERRRNPGTAAPAGSGGW